MKQLTMTLLMSGALPLMAETWTRVALVDANWSAKAKAAPDQHTRQCALGCANSGFGVLTADGSFLKFDDAGNTKALAVLRSTAKTGHLRATATGRPEPESLHVESIALD